MSGPKSRIAPFFKAAIGWGFALTIGAGIVGQLARDRSVALALLMYLPTIPMGLSALAWDTIRRGRALPGPRFGLGAFGLVAALGVAWPMLGNGTAADPGEGPEVSILHWNVVWGGGRARDLAKWEAICREILRHEADIVVLSEAPPDEWLDGLVGMMGPGASRVQVENAPWESYWYKLVVCSKGPARLVRREPIADGVGMVVDAGAPGREVRLLVVDARSHPFLSRTPRLLGVAAACRRAREAGAPIDVLVGDFNSVSRSVGFDAIEAEGYALASRAGTNRRGTFPSGLPLYDIDHIWVDRDRPGLRASMFTDLDSDHRGQVARFRGRARE